METAVGAFERLAYAGHALNDVQAAQQVGVYAAGIAYKADNRLELSL